MNRTWTNKPLAWVTRILSLVFIGLMAFAWWNESQARQDAGMSGAASTDFFWRWAVLTHLLPLLLIIAATAIGWKWPVYGLIGFGIFTVLQVISLGNEWVYFFVVVPIPLVMTVLYLVGFLLARRRQ